MRIKNGIRALLLLLLLANVNNSYSQLISTNPLFVTQNSNNVEIIFDASLGNGGLKDYNGSDVYAHTGLITSNSSNSSDWKHAPNWLDNLPKYKLVSLGNNKWKLTISPSIIEYYGVLSDEKILRLAFVFRNSNGTKQGKDINDKDIFIDIYNDEFSASFIQPQNSQTINQGSSVPISFGSSKNADLELFINGNSVQKNFDTNLLNFNYTFIEQIDYVIIGKATTNEETIFDTLHICVPETVKIESRPENLNDGINYINDSTVTFVFFAPGKNNVFLIGDFNNWIQQNQFQLKKDGDYWWITLEKLSPEKIYGFQYLVDNTLKITDPYSEMILDPSNDKWINSNHDIYPNMKPYPENKTDGLVSTFQIRPSDYEWKNKNFTHEKASNLVIYELLVRDFSSSKSIKECIDSLTYLSNLGINAIEIMPVQEFDGNNSWGYNPNHYFAPDKAYGDKNTYKMFIDECHKRGIAVILDIVLNHSTGQNPFAKLYWNNSNNKTASNNPWFNVDAPHPYSVFQDFNHEYSGTRQFFKRVIQFWLKEYHVDGYRLDLSKGLSQRQVNESTASTYDASRIKIISEYFDAAKTVNPSVIFILEHFCNNDEETELANKGMMLWRNVNNAFSQAAMGYVENSSFSALYANPMQWIGYAESHDEERNLYKVKRYGDANLQNDSIIRTNRVPLLFAFNILTPGPKMLWQFEELGYDHSIDSFGGRTSEKPSALGWLALPHRKAVYDDVSKIITLRQNYPDVFREGTCSLNIGQSDWINGRKIAITHSELSIMVLGNFRAKNNSKVNIKFPFAGDWYELLSGNKLMVSNTNSEFLLSPGEVLIYTSKQITNLPTKEFSIFPSITQGKLTIKTPGKLINSNIFNVQGSFIKSFHESNTIDISNLPNGIYLLNVVCNEGQKRFKVIKQ